MVSVDVRERILAYVREQAAKPRDELVAAVAERQGQYLALIEGRSDEVAAASAAAGEWSIRELTRHVVLAHEGVAGIIEMLGRGEGSDGEALGEAGTMMDDDGRAFSSHVERLAATNARVVEAIRGLPAAPDLRVTAGHPWLGPLNCLEWAANQLVHDADHVQHARKILAAVG